MSRSYGLRWIAGASMVVALAVAACSGGSYGNGAPNIVPAGPNAQRLPTHRRRVKTRVKIKIPARHRRRHPGRHQPHFISNQTAGIIVNVYAASDTTFHDPLGTAAADVSAGSTDCTGASDGSRTCQFAVPAPTGSDVFVAKTYDQAPTAGGAPQGNVLAVGISTSETISPGTGNSVSFAVDGVVASVAVVVPLSFMHGTVANQENVGIVALDADQTPIIADTYSDASGNAVTIDVTQTLAGALGSTGPKTTKVVKFVNNKGTMTLSSVALTAPTTTGDALAYDGGARITSASCTPGSSCSGAFVDTITATPSNGATAGSATVTLLGPTVTQYAVSNGPVTGVTLGADGNLWFAPSGLTGVGAITPLGGVSEYPVLSGTPTSITSGSDSNLWVTESASSNIAAVNTSGALVTEAQATTSPGQAPTGITAGPDGNIYFTMNAGQQIGEVTIPGHTIFAPFGTSGHSPTGMTTIGGTMYWGYSDTTAIAYTTPTASSPPALVTAPGSGAIPNVAGDKNGNLWFVEPGHGGVIGEFALPGFSSSLYTVAGTATPSLQALVQGQDGNMYFADSANTTIGYIDLSGSTSVELPPLGETPYSITVGVDGNIWFGEGSHIGVYSW
jgi:streptogramin lyase